MTLSKRPRLRNWEKRERSSTRAAELREFIAQLRAYLGLPPLRPE